jgi:hypothetical protein
MALAKDPAVLHDRSEGCPLTACTGCGRSRAREVIPHRRWRALSSARHILLHTNTNQETTRYLLP